MTTTFDYKMTWQEKRIRALMSEADQAAAEQSARTGQPATKNMLECNLLLRGVPAALNGTLSIVDEATVEGQAFRSPAGVVLRSRSNMDGKPIVVEQFFNYDDIMVIAVVRIPPDAQPRIIRSS